MSPPRALRVLAGPRAAARLRAEGLQPAAIGLVVAAAGGPKGLILNPLDRLLFGRWLDGAGPQAPPLHLAGASIGAWRMACACAPDADAALAELARAYIAQDYPHRPGRAPAPAEVSRIFGAAIEAQFGPPGGPREAALLAHPRRRLHLVTARGRGLLAGRPPGPLRAALGFGMAWLGNAVARPGLGLGLERCLFSDPRSPLPLPVEADGLPTRRLPLDGRRFQAALRASCAIPVWLQPECDLPGCPPGPHWDGGLADYHFHWDSRALPPAPDGGPALMLAPHFQDRLVPGWFDKPWRRRHRASPALDAAVLLAPEPEWVASLPGAKLPDREDFRRWVDDVPARQAAWRRALAESQRLADDFLDWVDGRWAPTLHPLG